MKSKAYGWLAAAVLAAGLNASYHDGGLEWAHQAIDGIGHNVSAVLALASGHADQFLAEAQLASAKNETPACRLATAWTQIQTKMAQGENRLARMQSRFFKTGFEDRELAQSQRALDELARKSEVMAAQQEAAMDRIEAKRVRMEAETERHLQETMVMARIRPVAAMQMVKMETGCQHLRVTVPKIRIPQVHIPEIDVPDVHIPRVHIPEMNVSSMSVEAGPGPV
jgi:hypothetical protein